MIDSPNKTCKTCGKSSHYAKSLCKNCYMNAWRAAHPDYYVGHSRGLSGAEYRAIVSKPCGLCGTTKIPRKLDHDHSHCRKGQRHCRLCIRGPLCNPCNVGVGILERAGEDWLLRQPNGYGKGS